MNGTILYDTTNKTPAYIYSLEKKQYVNVLLAGSVVITETYQSLTSVYNGIATTICHTVPHTVVATVQINTV